MIDDAEEFIRLRSSRLKSEYDRSAWEEVPLSVWYEVIDKYPDYRQWVIHNKTVPLEILEYLCNFGERLRTFVAEKRKLSPELFERLSRDVSSDVRTRIAVNKKTPLPILERLMHDEDEDIVETARYQYQLRMDVAREKAARRAAQGLEPQ
ncbi:hypothetical protein [Pseudomonas entomophila]|uniref:hypothetical protein n=1 Tax=Pseudomonas entomophila TaxID=312306 RepID=UPI00200D60A9|nr:hypothetical protein [Pseudomonas entomophila]